MVVALHSASPELGYPLKFLAVGALAIMASGCAARAPLTFKALAKRCVAERLDEPACAEAKLAAIAQQRAPGDPGPLVCKGGFQDGELCATSADCREEAVCWQGPNDGERCTTNFDCNTSSQTGSDLCFHAPTQVCDSDADCPGICEGTRAPCNDDADCAMPVCDGGIDDGQRCNNNNDCRGTCVNSSLAGTPCTSDDICSESLCTGLSVPGDPSSGVPCNSDADCTVQCNGGDRAGQPCDNNFDCPGGGLRHQHPLRNGWQLLRCRDLRPRRRPM